MKIGEEVYVHGYVHEMRKDVVIIKNNGGYFGTVEEEIRREEPYTGNWIYTEGFVPYKFKCDKCSILSRAKSKFCPNCGAKMEV